MLTAPGITAPGEGPEEGPGEGGDAPCPVFNSATSKQHVTLYTERQGYSEMTRAALCPVWRTQ